jgi:hypothetical protein
MSNGDQILRAYAMISSLQKNLPPHDYEVEESWVVEFNTAVAKVESALGIGLAEFKVSNDSLVRSVATSNAITGEINYREGRWCRRETLQHKIDAILHYFTGLQTDQEKKIGFKSS